MPKWYGYQICLGQIGFLIHNPVNLGNPVQKNLSPKTNQACNTINESAKANKTQITQFTERLVKFLLKRQKQFRSKYILMNETC